VHGQLDETLTARSLEPTAAEAWPDPGVAALFGEDSDSDARGDEEPCYVGSKRRRHFHRPTCEWATYIPDYLRLEFGSHREAGGWLSPLQDVPGLNAAVQPVAVADAAAEDEGAVAHRRTLGRRRSRNKNGTEITGVHCDVPRPDDRGNFVSAVPLG
jgi:hypothetical protein